MQLIKCKQKRKTEHYCLLTTLVSFFFWFRWELYSSHIKYTARTPDDRSIIRQFDSCTEFVVSVSVSQFQHTTSGQCINVTRVSNRNGRNSFVCLHLMLFNQMNRLSVDDDTTVTEKKNNINRTAEKWSRHRMKPATLLEYTQCFGCCVITHSMCLVDAYFCQSNGKIVDPKFSYYHQFQWVCKVCWMILAFFTI